MAGKHRKRRLLPPKVPLHPSAAAAAVAAERAAPGVTTPAAPQQDMTLFEAYRDLQLRWKRTTRQSRKKFCIARKWRQHLACQPQPEPSWLLFLHPQMNPTAERSEAHEGPTKHSKAGRRKAAALQQHSCGRSTQALQQHAQQPSAPQHQQQHLKRKQDLAQEVDTQQEQKDKQVQGHVTVGDLVQTEKLHRKQAGDKVVFGTVLLVGTREWTLLGKPTIRHWVTLIRIEEIEVDVEMEDDPPLQPPKRLLDLWANRWLYPEELAGIKTDVDGKPLAEGENLGKLGRQAETALTVGATASVAAGAAPAAATRGASQGFTGIRLTLFSCLRWGRAPAGHVSSKGIDGVLQRVYVNVDIYVAK
ncbi:hypothetical protein, conserved [Eimeria brunetti]|uniref:Uncharacterized protein n=1 Tax=Eimeria brunetti TaxID=51314 RepID=U6LFY8_9EIME|nr:hypothetical protein, conserved [Eimeria brunetti]